MTGSSSGNSDPYNGNPLYVTSADQPGCKLVNIPFNGSNFQKWSRAIKITLAAKVKTGFITGTCKRPEQNLNMLILINGFELIQW